MDNIIGKIIGIDKDAEGDIIHILTTDDTSPINRTSNPWCEIIMHGDLMSQTQKGLAHIFYRAVLPYAKKVNPEYNEATLDAEWKIGFGMYVLSKEVVEVSADGNKYKVEVLVKIPISLGDEDTMSAEYKKWNKHTFMEYFDYILKRSVEDFNMKTDDFEVERIRRVKNKQKS